MHVNQMQAGQHHCQIFNTFPKIIMNNMKRTASKWEHSTESLFLRVAVEQSPRCLVDVGTIG